jgi:hypothetical protein
MALSTPTRSAGGVTTRRRPSGLRLSFNLKLNRMGKNLVVLMPSLSLFAPLCQWLASNIFRNSRRAGRRNCLTSGQAPPVSPSGRGHSRPQPAVPARRNRKSAAAAWASGGHRQQAFAPFEHKLAWVHAFPRFALPSVAPAAFSCPRPCAESYFASDAIACVLGPFPDRTTPEYVPMSRNGQKDPPAPRQGELSRRRRAPFATATSGRTTELAP